LSEVFIGVLDVQTRWVQQHWSDDTVRQSMAVVKTQTM